MKAKTPYSLAVAATMLAFAPGVHAQVSRQTSDSISAPSKVETRLGSLEYRDGIPAAATVDKMYDSLDLQHAVQVYLNAFAGVSTYAAREGFRSSGAEDNQIVIFRSLMDAKSLFLTANADTVARTLNARTAMLYHATGITPAMIMRLPDVGSQYLMAFYDADTKTFDGAKTYKVTLPPNIPGAKFWSFTVYDNQTCSMLDTPQRYPRAESHTHPSPAAVPNADGSTTVSFGPRIPPGVQPGNWVQTMPGKKGWNTILRLYSLLEPFFTKAWRPTEIELVK